VAPLRLVFLFAILPSAVLGCATRPVSEAVLVVYEQHVDAQPLSRLALASLHGIERVGPAGAFQVTGTATGARIAYRDPDGVTRKLDLAWDASTPSAAVLRELERAVAFVEDQARLRSLEINSAMISGLMTLDTDGEYLDSKTNKELTEAVPRRAGIGLEMTKRQQTPTVVSPIEGLTAERAGLRARDRILRIDGHPTDGLSLSEVVRLLRGSQGSTVRLAVAREGWSEPREIEIKREIHSVKAIRAVDLGSGVAYVRLRRFGEATPRELRTAIARLADGGMTRLVLDLRNNGGGHLTAAVEVAELFLEEGRLVVYTKSRIRNQNLRFSAHPQKSYRAPPMVVLMNHGSAAASEIVAAALQDWGRATLIGERSFGRASIQTLVSLKDGSALLLTTARWFTPKGRQVADGVGLLPDVDVVADADIDVTSADPTKDNQLRRALEVLATLR